MALAPRRIFFNGFDGGYIDVHRTDDGCPSTLQNRDFGPFLISTFSVGSFLELWRKSNNSSLSGSDFFLWTSWDEGLEADAFSAGWEVSPKVLDPTFTFAVPAKLVAFLFLMLSAAEEMYVALDPVR